MSLTDSERPNLDVFEAHDGELPKLIIGLLHAYERRADPADRRRVQRLLNPDAWPNAEGGEVGHSEEYERGADLGRAFDFNVRNQIG